MYFTAIEKFDRDNGERWADYARWIGRSDLIRIVTLDSLLCPPVVHAESAEDWQFVAQEDFMLDFFTDLDFVLRGLAGHRPAEVVAVLREPSAAEVENFTHPDFEFAGFDLLDTRMVASALLGSGRFPEMFDLNELGPASGLLLSHERAGEIRDGLRRRYPDRENAQCNVWALWRYVGILPRVVGDFPE